MLFTFATFNPIDDPDIQIEIRACTAGNTTTSTKALTATSVPEPLYTSKSATAFTSNDSHIQQCHDNRAIDEDDEHPLPLCRASNSVNTTARWISGKPEKISTAADVSAEDGIIGAIRNIQEFLRNPINCDEAVVYGYSQGVLVGLHAGTDIANRELAVGFVDRIVDRLLDDSQSDNGLGRLIVQNCCMELETGSPQAQFMKVGYYEAWNHQRPCPYMTPQQIPSSYTHIHFSFTDITPSFGACVDFVLTHGLDGMDFDWEYPDQPDIPGIPPGDPQEAEDYLEFVKIFREKMPGDKTVSIAAPASYWYLKQFLIAEMSEHLDYIIYMTYDLHAKPNMTSHSYLLAGGLTYFPTRSM
ncbi:glycoside hydrolase family 18 protein [Colletotrichum sp. SAR 10_70]|nr:glycoside hydrolase family 18 protein [Colletotrichum sp. SAR 10_70]